MINLFQNHEVKKSVIYLIATITLIVAIGLFGYQLGVNKLKEQLYNEQSAIIGAINNYDSNITVDIVSIITKGNAESDNIKVGQEILSKYGHDDRDINIGDFKILVLILLGIATIMILKEIITYRSFYNGIDKFNESLDKVINGDYSVRINDHKEGQFYALSKNLNRLIEIVNTSINSLKDEKIFLKDIISDISHQLKTPLSTLSIYNELMEGKMLGEVEQDEILQNSRNVLDKMEWLIINLLKLAKFEVKAVEFNKRSTSIKEVLNSSIMSLHGKSLQNNNDICLSGDDVLLNVDGEWIEEGFINIIKNAIEHSKYGGKININIEDNIIWTKVSIEDFGEGIEEKDLNKIFNRFYKSKNSKPDSIGIGLSLSRSIFSGNGANIEVSSKMGIGTKFTATFLKI